MKHIGVDVDYKQADGYQQLSDQGINRADTTFRVPVMCAMTSLANGRITVRTRRVMRKPALTNVGNDLACGLIGGDLVLEDTPCVINRLGVR